MPARAEPIVDFVPYLLGILNPVEYPNEILAIVWSPEGASGAIERARKDYPNSEIRSQGLASGEDFTNPNIYKLNPPAGQPPPLGAVPDGEPFKPEEFTPLGIDQILEVEDQSRKEVPPIPLRYNIPEVGSYYANGSFTQSEEQKIDPSTGLTAKEQALNEEDQKIALLLKFDYLRGAGNSKFQGSPFATLKTLQETWDKLNGDQVYRDNAGPEDILTYGITEKPWTTYPSTDLAVGPYDDPEFGVGSYPWPGIIDVAAGEPVDRRVVQAAEFRARIIDAGRKAEALGLDSYLQPSEREKIAWLVYGADIPDDLRLAFEKMGIYDYGSYQRRHEPKPVVQEVVTGTYDEFDPTEIHKVGDLYIDPQTGETTYDDPTTADSEIVEDVIPKYGYFYTDPTEDGGEVKVDEVDEVDVTKEVVPVVDEDKEVKPVDEIADESGIITILENGVGVSYYYNANTGITKLLADVTREDIDWKNWTDDDTAQVSIAQEIARQEAGTMVSNYPYGSVPTVEDAFGPSAGYQAGLGLWGLSSYTPYQRAQLDRYRGYQSMFDVQNRLGLLGESQPGVYGGSGITQKYLGQYAQPPQATTAMDAADIAPMTGREQYYKRARDLFRTTAGLTPFQQGEIGLGYDPSAGGGDLKNVLRAALMGGGQLSRAGINFLLERLPQDYTAYSETPAGSAEGGGDFLTALIDKYNLRRLTRI
jgi:hypothetical protein